MADRRITMHVGRSWPGDTHLEDGCPCPKEPCGLVSLDRATPDCEQHGRNHSARSMRQGHPGDRCPGSYTPVEAPDA